MPIIISNQTSMNNRIYQECRAVCEHLDWDDVSLGEIDLSIGKLENFTGEEFREFGDMEYNPFRIFIHNGIVFVKCTGRLHSEIASVFNNEFMKKTEIGRNKQIISILGRTIYLVNKLGCHASFGKIPDWGIYYKEMTGHGLPLMVLEVAVSHESLNHLLLHASSYLNSYSVARYFIGIKARILRNVNKGFEIIVAKKITEEAFDPISNEPSLKKVSCKTFPQYNPWKMSDLEIEEIYKIKIVFHQT